MKKNKEYQDSCVDPGYTDCVDPRYADCGDCEPTYSSKEYYALKKEIYQKDQEIILLKRKVEALEHLVCVYILPDDRRAD